MVIQRELEMPVIRESDVIFLVKWERQVELLYCSSSQSLQNDMIGVLRHADRSRVFAWRTERVAP
jgi:hypothetical protein